ncbi:CDGSH iron-sulfur domain-containing protein [Streptomyces sp. NPDC003327]
MSHSEERARDEGPDPQRSAVPRVTPVTDGPLLIEGPVEVVLPDGTVRRCERPVIALCVCRRSLRQPFCDTSHRPRMRPARRSGGEGRGEKEPAAGTADRRTGGEEATR